MYDLPAIPERLDNYEAKYGAPDCTTLDASPCRGLSVQSGSQPLTPTACSQLGNGTANFTQSPTLVQQYIQQALSALSAPQLTPPQLSVNGSTNSSDPAVAAAAAAVAAAATAAASVGASVGAASTVDAVVSCLAPAGAQDVVPAVLWDLASSDGTSGGKNACSGG